VDEIGLDIAMTAPLHCSYPSSRWSLALVVAGRIIAARMRNLRFGFFDDSGLPRESRILMFYSFDTEENLTRSGILHYHVPEGRFVGPRHDVELTSAALEFLSRNGRIPEASAS
jgi:hypothetical protein